MRRAAWGALLLVTSCAGGGPPAAAPPPTASPVAPADPATAAAEVTAVWDVERADAASRRVDVTYLAAACSAVRRIDVEEAGDRVVITLGNGASAGRECTEPLLRHRTVTLKAPLGTRDLYDGGADPPVLVRPGT
ncbi:MAG TPA: hypothetical protein VGX28_04365 [Frankiaceae bacterium]|jgi:hypothetical protein|nr:hypothetical protein [Frankiaceae bacterium]